MWHDYVKNIQNIERWVIDFFYWVSIQMIEPRNHVLCRWKIDKSVWLYGVTKRIDRLVVGLKAIKYRRISFAIYLSILKTLAFKLHVSWPNSFGRMLSKLSYPWRNAFILPNFLGSQICSTIYTPICSIPRWTQKSTSLSIIGLTKH